MNSEDIAQLTATQIASRFGFHCFPLRKGGHAPSQPQWPERSTKNPDTIYAWDMDAYGIHAGPSGLLIIDVDNEYTDANGVLHHEGADGLASWDQLQMDHGQAPTTFTVKTQGGMHYYYKLPEGVSAGNSASKLAPGVDTRAGNGYVVGPGSDNGAYKIMVNRKPAVVPSWVIELLSGHDGMREEPPLTESVPVDDEWIEHRISLFLGDIAQAKQGVGNTTLARAAWMIGQYVGAGHLTSAKALQLITETLTSSWTYTDPQDRTRDLTSVRSQLEKGSRAPWKGLKVTAVEGLHPDMTPAELERVLTDLAALPSRLSEGTVASYRKTLTDLGLIAPTTFDKELRRLRNGKATARAVAEQERATEAKQAGKLTPSDWEGLAKLLKNEWAARGVYLKYWQGSWYKFTGTFWREVKSESVAWLVRKSLSGRSFLAKDRNGDDLLKPWNVDTRVEREAGAALKALCARDDDKPAMTGVFTINGLYDLSQDVLKPIDPRAFNLAALPFDYDSEAQCPKWLKFINECLPADQVATLQEWFGYVVSGRNDLQTMLFLRGAPAAGKSIVLNVLQSLVGEGATTIKPEQLAEQFGMSHLIGKTSCAMPEASWDFRKSQAAIDTIKSITGGDEISIDRKNRDMARTRLNVRFTIVSNKVPTTLRDASGALFRRIIWLETNPPKAASERINNLGEQIIIDEMSGVLNWAIEGLRRVDERKRFVQPSSSASLGEQAQASGSSLQAFVDEHCEKGPNFRVAVGDLYEMFRMVSEGNGEFVPSVRHFGGELREMDMVPTKSGSTRYWKGLRLKA